MTTLLEKAFFINISEWARNCSLNNRAVLATVRAGLTINPQGFRRWLTILLYEVARVGKLWQTISGIIISSARGTSGNPGKNVFYASRNRFGNSLTELKILNFTNK